MIPERLTAAVMTGIEQTRLEEREMPEPGPGEVLIEIAAVGVCGSDVHWYRDGRIGQTTVDAPLVLGHEASGRIVAVGAGVDPLRSGQRVALEPGVPCRTCAQCSSGRYNLCPDVRFLATPPVDGAFATHIVLDEHFAHPVPDALDDERAALVEPLAVAMWAVRKARIAVGDRVLVSGAGPIGLLVLQVARTAGARVAVSDPAPARRERAAGLGADAVADPRAEGVTGPFDVLLECSGNPAAIAAGLRALAPAGRAVLVGMAADPGITVPLDVLQARELTVSGTFRYANAYPDAIRLAAEGRVALGELVTSRHGLDDVHGALLAAVRDPLALKPVVLPQQDRRAA